MTSEAVMRQLSLILPDKSQGGQGTEISRNWREIEAWARRVADNIGTGGGKPYASIVIGSANTFSPSWADGVSGVDFTASNADATDAINAAMTLVESKGWPSAEIVFLEGQYAIDAGNINVPFGVSLRGMGHYATELYNVGSTATPMFKLDNGSNRISNLYVSSGGRYAFEGFGTNVVVNGCQLEGAGLHSQGSAIVTNNIFSNNSGSVPCIKAEDGYSLYANNIFSQVDADVVFYLYGASTDLIIGNVFRHPSGGGSASNTGIKVEASTGVAILSNMFNDSAKWDPAIDILASSTDTYVTGNVLKGATTPIADAGTGTVLTFPGDATYGDNFTGSGGGGGSFNPTWTTYTPTWTSDTGSPSIGDGVMTAKYMVIGKVMLLQFFMKIGSTTNTGGQVWRFTTPSGYTIDNASNEWSGNALGRDLGVTFYSGIARTPVGENAFSIAASGSGYEWGNTVPFTWGNGDEVVVSMQLPIV